MSKSRVILLFFILTTLVIIPSAHAQTYSLLYTFTGGANGAVPDQRLTLDSAGNLYGANNNNNGYGSDCGTIFKIDKSGKFSLLYSFTGGADGCAPEGGLVWGGSGNIYGVASGGGIGSCAYGGCGTIFKLDKKSHLTPLYSFTGGTDGWNPGFGLVRDSAGNLYGTAFGGSYGYGTVFALDTTNHLTVLYTFTGGTDGGNPLGPMVRDAAGNLYGNTRNGGDLNCTLPGWSGGCGTVYKLDTSGKLTVLHAFSGGADGALPGAVIRAGTNLYGATQQGGDLACFGGGGGGCGVVFKIDGKDKFSVLYSFTGGTDGSESGSGGWGGGLARDPAGNLYGATTFGGDLTCLGGGSGGCGTVFKLDSKGNLIVLYDFTGGPDGTPSFYGTDLVRDVAGNLYGVTLPWDGNPNQGTVFEVTPYPVSFSPASLPFSAQTVGTTSAPKTVTLFNNQSVALNITSIVASAEFSAVPGGTKPCASAVAANSSCTFVVRFSPTKIGTISGSVTVTDDAPTSPQAVALTGKGQ